MAQGQVALRVHPKPLRRIRPAAEGGPHQADGSEEDTRAALLPSQLQAAHLLATELSPISASPLVTRHPPAGMSTAATWDCCRADVHTCDALVTVPAVTADAAVAAVRGQAQRPPAAASAAPPPASAPRPSAAQPAHAGAGSRVPEDPHTLQTAPPTANLGKACGFEGLCAGAID